MSALITASSGNVFADLGFADPEGEQRKADLVIAIRDAIEARGWSDHHAAKLAGISVADLRLVLRGRNGDRSVDDIASILVAVSTPWG